MWLGSIKRNIKIIMTNSKKNNKARSKSLVTKSARKVSQKKPIKDAHPAPQNNSDRVELKPQEALFVYSTLLSILISFTLFIFSAYKFGFTASLPLGFDTLFLPVLIFTGSLTYFILKFYQSLMLYKEYRKNLSKGEDKL